MRVRGTMPHSTAPDRCRGPGWPCNLNDCGQCCSRPQRSTLSSVASPVSTILRHGGRAPVSCLQCACDGVLRWVWLRRLHRGERPPLRPPTCAQHGQCMLPTAFGLPQHAAHLECAKDLLQHGCQRERRPHRAAAVPGNRSVVMQAVEGCSAAR